MKNITSFGTSDKKENINGLQIADLVAYPIARKIIDPGKINPAFNVCKNKILSKGLNQRIGCGLKIFPDQNGYENIFD